MLDLFTDDERVVLRFGMLPAEKMRCIEQSFRERVLAIGSVRPLVTEDRFVAVMADDHPGPRFIEFSLKELVSEALHEISLAIYKIGDLVV
jgi:hypothetical protein